MNVDHIEWGIRENLAEAICPLFTEKKIHQGNPEEGSDYFLQIKVVASRCDARPLPRSRWSRDFFPPLFGAFTRRREKSYEERKDAAEDSPSEEEGTFDDPRRDQRGEEGDLNGETEKWPDQRMKGPDQNPAQEVSDAAAAPA